ncbi:MAG: hypothetical protein JWO82_3617 [Akkermansiaceae bacterium]|nr:hypothetical protein [Akkermansiaceae bacterium]
MPGERYFAARDRLAEISTHIAGLARDTGLEVPEHDPVPDVGRPILLAAIGEVNAGKSSLLNAIAGVEVCPAAALPLTKEIRLYRYGGSAMERAHDGGVLECRRPVPFLKNFELLDTPGTNATGRPEPEQIDPWLNAAEFVMVVFTAENPWTAATWDAVSRLSDETLERTVLVVQRTDLKQPQDIPIILGHMRDLCLKRTGRALPIFPVSAKYCLEAKSSPSGAPEAWSASRFAVFEDYISSRVCESFARRQILHDSWHHASRTLRRLEERFDLTRRGMDDDAWFLTGIEREMDALRDEHMLAAPRSLSAMLDRYRTAVGDIVHHLRSRLGWARTVVRLFLGDTSPAALEAMFATRMHEVAQSQGDGDAARLLDACAAHWQTVRPRVAERMGFDPGPCLVAGVKRDESIGRFTARLEKAVPHALANLRVRGVLDPLLRRRNHTLKLVVAIALLLATLAGVLGTLGKGGLPYYVLAASGATLVGSVLIAWTTLATISIGYRERLLDSAPAYASALEADYGEAIRTLFHEYSQGLIEVRRQLADRKAALQPRLEHWNNLFIALKAVELEM